jgi:hypothetical protein
MHKLRNAQILTYSDHMPSLNPNQNKRFIVLTISTFVALLFVVMTSSAHAVTAQTQITKTVVGLPAPIVTVLGTGFNTANIGVVPNGGKTVDYSMNLATSDVTGTGDGWHLEISQTPFTDASGDTLGASSVVGVNVLDKQGSTDTDPVDADNSVQLPVVIPSNGASSSFLVADPGTGLGNFIVTPTIQVDVPSGATIANYSATTTVHIITGP